VQLLSVGLNFQTAPLALRERIAVSGPSLENAISRLRARVTEGFILSTCNRTEFYALVGHAESGADILQTLLCEIGQVSKAELTPYIYQKAHEEAVKHLFLVAAGVQSMVPGEDQILAQLKEALDLADKSGALGPIMHRLGASALSVGKRVRSETEISRHALSVVSVALQLAAEQLGTLEGRQVAVIGAGHTAELALKHLSKAGPAAVTVVNRTAEHAVDLAARHGAQVAPWTSLEQTVAAADLVLSCTSASASVLSAGLVSRAVAGRENVVLFDLAVPRDIEPAAADLPGVTLWDIDSLQEICSENRQRRTDEIARAEALADTDVQRFMSWWSARQVAPTITALLAQAEAIREAELERTLTRLSFASEREEEIVRALVGRVMNKLLHRPITLLKQDPEGANMAHVVRHLFGLAGDAGAAALRESDLDAEANDAATDQDDADTIADPTLLACPRALS
jgi:glutamyl-tRNA reductase